MAILGCIADDFTGASDMASFLVKGGMKTILYNGIPARNGNDMEADAIVIALKTRMAPKEEAVRDSLNAVKWLESKGCQHFYIKYCSTFDSTKEGNIGPICDAALDHLREPFTILCPALPVNGRTVKEGKLYVQGIPLDESPMKDHPLTPMWSSEIRELMEAQSRYHVFVEKDTKWEIPGTTDHYYLVPDYVTEEDGRKIVEQFGNLKLLTGGSGIAEELARMLLKKKRAVDDEKLHSLLLAGSCSVMTRKQIENYQKSGKKSIKMTPDMISEDCDPEKIWQKISAALKEEDVLVYSSDEPENVEAAQKKCGDISKKLEEFMADIAERAVASGVKNIIVAGGETSGAVTRNLGMQSFLIGESVAPGVPVMIPAENRSLRLVLKSGNFGQEDFFRRALDMVGGKEA